MKGSIGSILMKVFLVLVIGFFTIPIISLIVYLLREGGINIGERFIQSLMVSLKSTGITVLINITLGIPIAYYLSRNEFKGKRAISMILNIPILCPPSVAGIILLLAFGRQGVVGKLLNGFGVNIPFTFIAVIMAQCFVSLPLFIQIGKEAFDKVDVEIERSALLLGMSPIKVFSKVTIPMALFGLLKATIMSWGRAFAEFGATIIFAGNLGGKTQTLPLAIYSAMEGDFNEALSMALIMIIVAVAVLIVISLLGRKSWD